MKSKRKISSIGMVMALLFVSIMTCSDVVNAANTKDTSYSFNSYNSYGYTSWRPKDNDSKVYVHPESGPKIYYTVGGLKNGTSYKCSNRFAIPKDTYASITNSVNEAGCKSARLRFEPVTKRNINTTGVWSPDSTRNYTIYN